MVTHEERKQRVADATLAIKNLVFSIQQKYGVSLVTAIGYVEVGCSRALIKLRR